MTPSPDPHAEVVGRERLLPGLRLLFAPEQLAGVLEAHSGEALSSLEPVYIRY